MNRGDDSDFESRAMKYMERERSRLPRLLNEKTRTIGLDLDSLESQIQDKSRRKVLEHEHMNRERGKMLAAMSESQNAVKCEKTARREKQRLLASALSLQSQEKQKRDETVVSVPSSEGPANMSNFTGLDVNYRARLNIQKKKQAEWLKQQIFEKKFLETEAVSVDCPPKAAESSARIDRSEIMRLVAAENRTVAESKATLKRLGREIAPTSIPEWKVTDFKGLPRKQVKEELIKGNQRLWRTKQEQRAKEVEEDRKLQLERDMRHESFNLQEQGVQNNRREQQIESLRLSRENDCLRNSRQEALENSERLVNARYDEDFLAKRFGNSLTCT